MSRRSLRPPPRASAPMHPKSPHPVLALAVVAALAAGASPLAAETRSAAPFDGSAPLTLDAVVEAVLERNPDLEAARLAWRAALERPAQLAALPDPMVTGSLAPLSIGSSDVGFGVALEARQDLPYPTDRRLAAEAARAGATASAARADEVRLALAHAAAGLWLDLQRIDRELEVNAQHLVLLDELFAAVTGRYAAGLAPQQAPLQAEIERVHLVHREVSLQADRSVVAARLNALLHRDPVAPLPPLAALPPVPAPDGTAHGPAVVAHGSAHAAPGAIHGGSDEPGSPTALRPELAAADAELRARELEVELAGRARRPALGVMASYSSMWRETEHRWMAGVSVGLPVWRDRIRAAEAEAEAERSAAGARREALADRIAAEVSAAESLLAEMHHVVDLYESRLLPPARDQVAAARSGLSAGTVDFPTTLEAEKTLRSVELAREEARIDLVRRRLDLDRALGRLPMAGGEIAHSHPTLDPDPPPGAAPGAAAGGDPE